MRYLVALIIGIGALLGVNVFADLVSMPRPWNALLMGATVGITMVVVLLVWEVVKPSNMDAVPAMSEEERANARAERRSRLAAEAGVSLEDSEGSSAKSTPSTDDGETAGAGAETSTAGTEVSAAGAETPADADAESEDDRREAKVSGRTAVPEMKQTEGPDVGAAPPIRPAVSEDEESPESDESSIEAEPTEVESTPRESTPRESTPRESTPKEGTEAESTTGETSRSEASQNEPSDTEGAWNDPDTLAPGEFDEEATGSSLENPPTGEPGISVDALEEAEPADADASTNDSESAEDASADDESGEETIPGGPTTTSPDTNS